MHGVLKEGSKWTHLWRKSLKMSKEKSETQSENVGWPTDDTRSMSFLIGLHRANCAIQFVGLLSRPIGRELVDFVRLRYSSNVLFKAQVRLISSLISVCLFVYH
jgi:hypothetical protein